MPSVQIAITTSVPGNFSVPHGLGVTPSNVNIEMTSGGFIWFQPSRYDSTDLYLTASSAGLTAVAIVYYSTSVTPPSFVNTIGNSSITLQDIVDDASTLGDVAPALATGGASMFPALSIANDVMQAIINGGNMSQPYNWKWNRFNLPAFPTISLQQDYFIPGLSNLGWLESAWGSQINQTSITKNKITYEVHKDLLVTYQQSSGGGKICWIPNDQALTGTWGASPLGPTASNPSGQTTQSGPNQSGQQNPGPNVVYTNPLGTLLTPQNATTCIRDPYGNLYALTTFGTCGTSAPMWVSTPVYPTVRNPTITATTIVDGTCVWTAVDPKGQAIRLNPIPPLTGVVWLIQPVGQMRCPKFTNLDQFLNPLPDDFCWAFKSGFFAECYRRNPDPRIRARYPQERQLWLESLDKAVRQSDREMDDVGFYPSDSIMDMSYGYNYISPARPFNQ